MATIIFSRDYAISELMPSGGGPLAAGDTLQLQGFNLIVDADAVDYPVTIANSGGDCNLELRDLGRIKLNATLPTNVHPYIDPAHPLPVSAEPGVDGDPYRTDLTANARAEIQLAGNFGLGGGPASLPTETRAGAFWKRATEFPSANEIVFEDASEIHVGDILQFFGHPTRLYKYTVASISENIIATLETISPNVMVANSPWTICGGGVCINGLLTTASFLGQNCVAGTLILLGSQSSGSGGGGCFVGEYISADRVLYAGADNAAYNTKAFLASPQSACEVRQLSCPRIFYATSYSATAKIGEVVCGRFANENTFTPFSEGVQIGGGFQSDDRVVRIGGNSVLKIENFDFPNTVECSHQTAVDLRGCKINGVPTGQKIIELAGTITPTDVAWYHAPATSADVTWRYADRTVPAGATLRLRCAWLREGSAASSASVAVTDPATWWPQLWPLGAEALASVEFTGGTADWRSELLTWRNTGTEAAQVRIWECVTGTTAGGYLKVEEVKGGAL